MLGGYSGGGLVAFEMAQQLTAAGEDVALVVMFDTFPPQIPDRDITVAMRLRLAARRADGLPQAHRDASRRRPPRCRASCARAEDIAARGGVVPVELRDMHVQHSFVRAADKYVLRPWTGHVVLMRAEEAGFEAIGLGPDLRLGRGGRGRRRGRRGARQPRHAGARAERHHARPPAAGDARPHPGRPPVTLTRRRLVAGCNGIERLWQRRCTMKACSPGPCDLRRIVA